MENRGPKAQHHFEHAFQALKAGDWNRWRACSGISSFMRMTDTSPACLPTLSFHGDEPLNAYRPA